MRGCIIFVALGLLGGLGVTLFGEVLSGNPSALLWLLALIAAAVTAIVYANRLSAERKNIDDTPGDDEEETEDEEKRHRFRDRLGLAGVALFIAMFPVSILLSIFEVTNALAPYVMGVGGVGFLLSLFAESRGSGAGGEGGDGGGE
ncbi:hypothetical protein ACFW4K_07785 [Nocardiopsis alba]|uniref:hypothetical protein n=1 Tax=Nocardiopsis alba TaxID=53437 RepID=UPI00367160CB